MKQTAEEEEATASASRPEVEAEGGCEVVPAVAMGCAREGECEMGSRVARGTREPCVSELSPPTMQAGLSLKTLTSYLCQSIHNCLSSTTVLSTTSIY